MLIDIVFCWSLVMLPQQIWDSPYTSTLEKEAHRENTHDENNSDHLHPPYLQISMPPKPYNEGLHDIKSLKIKGFLQKNGTRTQKSGMRAPPFMPYEPFLLGHLQLRLQWIELICDYLAT